VVESKFGYTRGVDGNTFARVIVLSRLIVGLSGRLVCLVSGSTWLLCCAGTPDGKYEVCSGGAVLCSKVWTKDDAKFTPIDMPCTSWLDAKPSVWDRDCIIDDLPGMFRS